ncbi:STYKc [Musa troglodytarum]|uniref:STYKc n=2 Tax=Musa troglodytarum TaxID=320322 RepID=A0A9E7F2X5_9LILI|nr:STYKc [Musa troglodytarum]
MGKMRRWLCCYHQVDEPYHVSENEYRKSPTNNTDGPHRGSKYSTAPKSEPPKAPAPIEVPALSLEELKEKTDNFGSKSLIGEGSYGRVYFAVLDNRKQVAVKKLDASSEENSEEFLTQVATVSRLKHANFVEMLGYCVEGNMRMMAYEFATMGSLHDVLHGRKGVQGAQPGPVLDWTQRVRIAVDAAKGLEFLHEKETLVFMAECSYAFHFPYIVAYLRSHTNLACPAYSAFWCYAPFLSLVENKVAVAYATIVATKVYDDNELLLLMSKPNQGGGVRFNLIPEATNEDKDEEAYSNDEEMEDVERDDEFYGLVAAPRARFASCTDGATPRLSEDKVKQCIDPRLKGDYPPKGVAKLAAVAALCVQYEAEFRPNMSIVVKALSPLLMNKQAPAPPPVAAPSQSPDA